MEGWGDHQEPLKIIVADNPVTYSQPGHIQVIWHCTMLKVWSWKPRTHEQFLALNKRYRITLWGDATTWELSQINNYDTSIDKGHHNKVKVSAGLKEIWNQIAQYQSMIDALQWTTTIGWWDINTAVITSSGSCKAPQVGHLNRLRNIYRYLLKIPRLN
jgi:hypothetical protein